MRRMTTKGIINAMTMTKTIAKMITNLRIAREMRQNTKIYSPRKNTNGTTKLGRGLVPKIDAQPRYPCHANSAPPSRINALEISAGPRSRSQGHTLDAAGYPR